MNTIRVRVEESNQPCKVIKINRRKSPSRAINQNNSVNQMKATTKALKALYARIDENQSKGKGMSSFPMDIYNKLIDHTLENGKYRDAMFFICMANWGMRFGDVVRVRYCHVFDENGNFRESFTLPDGEQKTGKNNIYYNNIATKEIISAYLNQENSNKTPFDFLFVSESNNKKTDTIRNIEVQELFGNQIKSLRKSIKDIEKQEKGLLKLFSYGTITETEFSQMKASLTEDRLRLETDYSVLENKMYNYRSFSDDTDDIRIQVKMTATAAQDIVKDNLEQIGIYPKNCKNKTHEVNLDVKFNTHSLRKTFSDCFYNTGCSLEELDLNPKILKLLQHKFMHSKASITNCYNKTEERAFRIICTNMNIGLDVLKKYL